VHHPSFELEAQVKVGFTVLLWFIFAVSVFLFAIWGMLARY